MFILIFVDDYDGIDCELIGVYSNYKDAHDMMKELYEDAKSRTCMDESLGDNCYIEDDCAHIIGRRDDGGSHWYIFDGTNE